MHAQIFLPDFGRRGQRLNRTQTTAITSAYYNKNIFKEMSRHLVSPAKNKDRNVLFAADL